MICLYNSTKSKFMNIWKFSSFDEIPPPLNNSYFIVFSGHVLKVIPLLWTKGPDFE